MTAPDALDMPTPETLPFPDLAEGRPDLIDTQHGVRLVGSQCRTCADICFPKRFTCLNCGSRDVGDKVLPDKGVLYTYSTVHISSSWPTPYTLGYVDLTNGVRLLSHIETNGTDLQMDCPVELKISGDSFVFVPIMQDGD